MIMGYQFMMVVAVLCSELATISAQHCLYPFHKHVRLPGPDKKTFRECVPPGNFELKDCPGDSEYDIQLQACKFVDGSSGEPLVDKGEGGTGNGLGDRMAKQGSSAFLGNSILPQGHIVQYAQPMAPVVPAPAPAPAPAPVMPPFAAAPPQVLPGGQLMPAGGTFFAGQQQQQQQQQGQTITGQWQPTTEAPIELLQNCALDAWCPHDPKKLQYCDLNGQQFLQCSASGWVLKSCPFGTHFVGPIGRCIDPREAGASGSVLAPPPAPMPMMPAPSTVSGAVPFAPPAFQGGIPAAAAPPAPAAQQPPAGNWIGNSVVQNLQPIVQANPPQQAPAMPASILPMAPPRATFAVPPPPAAVNTAPDLVLPQKTNIELPQGQLVMVNSLSGQFPQPQQQQFVNPLPLPTPVDPTLGTLHPRNKVFPQQHQHLAAPAPTPIQAIWPASRESVDGDPPPARWTDPSTPNTPPTEGGGLIGTPANQQPPVQSWVLGGNVQNLSPSTDIRELPMGTWVSSPLSPQQPLPAQGQWGSSTQQQTVQSVSGQAVDGLQTMGGRRYAAANTGADGESDQEYPLDQHRDPHGSPEETSFEGEE